MARIIYLTLAVSAVLAAAQNNNSCTLANEEWKQCATCEPTCDNRVPICTRNCQPSRCMCSTGFFRNQQGQCVAASECDTSSSTQCKKNESFLSCSSMCEAKCGQYGPMPCVLRCGPAKCQCTTGFYRSDNGECLSREECPK